MKKAFSVVLAILMMLLSAAAETEAVEGEKTEELYSLIEMSSLKTELDALYESAETDEGYFLFENEVLIAFYESGRLQAKIRVFENISDIAPVSNLPMDKLSSYKQGMTIDEVTEAFGKEGLEIMKINLADEDGAAVRRVLVWKTETGSIVQALFELDDNEWVLFAIAEVK